MIGALYWRKAPDEPYQRIAVEETDELLDQVAEYWERAGGALTRRYSSSRQGLPWRLDEPVTSSSIGAAV
jgi:hypothetical protein